MFSSIYTTKDKKKCIKQSLKEWQRHEQPIIIFDKPTEGNCIKRIKVIIVFLKVQELRKVGWEK